MKVKYSISIPWPNNSELLTLIIKILTLSESSLFSADSVASPSAVVVLFSSPQVSVFSSVCLHSSFSSPPSAWLSVASAGQAAGSSSLHLSAAASSLLFSVLSPSAACSAGGGGVALFNVLVARSSTPKFKFF